MPRTPRDELRVRHRSATILAVAGESLDGLFDLRHYLKPVADLRDELAAALPRRAAAQLSELCQVESSPRVSFETAETKPKSTEEPHNMRYKNNVGPQVRWRRYALGWPQSMLATELQIAGFDIQPKRRFENRSAPVIR